MAEKGIVALVAGLVFMGLSVLLAGKYMLGMDLADKMDQHIAEVEK